MKMVVEFDIGADLIEVPEWVIGEREQLRRRFLKWLFDPGVKHRWKLGGGCCYRSDAFVYWLNKKAMKHGERAVVLEMEVRDWDRSLPSIFF